MMNIGFTGDTSKISIVPVSFSRTIDIEVIMAQMRVKMSPITPGTKLYAPFIRGLYSNFTTGCIENLPERVSPEFRLCCADRSILVR